ncbi:hypothetical protein BC936DRAFT_140660 [Jimgerdemannia flammicorona]|uniref:Uncharacterized protein n=2 Tax=Jimgerdemannia flammicorona TaxID=994334 RepID=A0A433AGK8_9FUNG|nr:hypothetical protein BC936DRAFT_140660 [Jimgerdemannia flammicorona]RUS28855.1 hypothetical protein BC938DRAFT_481357 [Jimgerdemannia flammicorona]
MPAPTRTTKNTMIANPPRALCLHLSRSVYHPNGTALKNQCRVIFPEKLDLAPFTTTGHLSTKPEANLSGPHSALQHGSPDWYHRKRLSSIHSTSSLRPPGHPAREGLSIALGPTSKTIVHTPEPRSAAILSPSSSSSVTASVSGATPSGSVTPQPVRPVQYRLQAVVVHYGSHEQGHFVTYRRKKLPTGDHVPHVMIGQVVEVGHIGEGLSSLVSPEKKPSKFWQVSDEEVTEVDIETVMESEAYMLFYERD